MVAEYSLCLRERILYVYMRRAREERADVNSIREVLSRDTETRCGWRYERNKDNSWVPSWDAWIDSEATS